MIHGKVVFFGSMRVVRYGTALHAFSSARIFTHFPNSDEFPIGPPLNVVEAEEERCAHSFPGVSALDVAHSQTPDAPSTGLPSVSLINGCSVDAQAALYWWQYGLVKEMGITEFRKFIMKNLTAGTKFHSAVHNLLEALKATGEIPSLNDDFYGKYRDVRGFIESIAKFLPVLRRHELICMEEKVTCRRLGYQGKFDAIVELNGLLTLVDWKTVNTYSAKAQREEAETGLTLTELYSNPVQVAAYIGAVNASNAFAAYPPIRQGAIVLAYEDGRPAETVLMNEEEIEHHFQTHLYNLSYFWYQMANRQPDITGKIHLVFNPHTAETVPKKKRTNKKEKLPKI